jgi:Mn2+/Fe2+ NRAMP family transporter
VHTRAFKRDEQGKRMAIRFGTLDSTVALMFTSDKVKMGKFANPRWMKILAWVVTAVIIALNSILLAATFVG